MINLPLFPLNTVLFPGMPISLHIFEDRYKTMINLCLDKHRPFGVVFIEAGREALGPVPIPYDTGCTAHITNVQSLDEGRMNLIAVGQERFRIHSYETTDAGYLLGTVEEFPLIRTDDEQLGAAARRLRPLVKKYLKVLADLQIAEIDPDRLPDVPLPFAYLAASILQMPNENKQNLLTIENAVDFIDALCADYRREVALLPKMFGGNNSADDDSPFSRN